MDFRSKACGNDGSLRLQKNEKIGLKHVENSWKNKSEPDHSHTCIDAFWIFIRQIVSRGFP